MQLYNILIPQYDSKNLLYNIYRIYDLFLFLLFSISKLYIYLHRDEKREEIVLFARVGEREVSLCTLFCDTTLPTTKPYQPYI